MEVPPPWPSAERMAWAAVLAPWCRLWARRMRRAQAGAAEEPSGVGAASPAIVPAVELPPVAAKALRVPSRAASPIAADDRAEAYLGDGPQGAQGILKRYIELQADDEGRWPMGRIQKMQKV